MERHFIITIHLLLFVHTFYFVSLKNTTDSPVHTFNNDWLRQQDLVANEEGENGQEGDVSHMGRGNNSSSVVYDEENDVEQNEIEASDDLNVAITTEPPTSPNASTVQPELSDDKTNITNTESKQSNVSKTEGGFMNSTTPAAIPDVDLLNQNATISPDFSNHTDANNTTTLAPEILDFNENTTANTTTIKTTTITTSGNETVSTNVTESNETNVTTTAATEMNTTSATSSSPDPFPLEPTTVTTVAPETPEGNLTDKQASSGSSSNTGWPSETSRNKRNEAWGAILGTAVVVSLVGLVAYIILKKRHIKGFSHRKLVEEFPSEPVLRLDNGEPLDLNFGGSAYYNQGLQGDNIQMANLPRRQIK
ncbi:mucin-15 [Syngnathus acus]|uniref:mucin-15 n=1 Tax=Syngnathus acus TaxID=161584 RepID=UPI0018863A67|nr:mucin-15 [Syngnathus acus]XP_037103493.1 mucin-15 [Syngnathus acus]